MRRNLLFLLSMAVAAACESATAPIQQLPRELSQSEQDLVDADNRFAFDLLHQVLADEPSGANVFVSPLSVAMALGMTYNGAAGTTRDEMQAVLHITGMDVEEVNGAYRSLLDLLRGLDTRVEFSIANSIWYHDAFPARQSFLDLNQSYFDATVRALDFADPAAAETINAWVRGHTAGRIDEIVPDPIPHDVVMYLLNAIYFNGDWTYQFDPDRTEPGPFTRHDGSMTSTPFMHHEGTIPVAYLRETDFELFELPYGGDAFRMTVLLPDEGVSLDTVLDGMDATRWQALLTQSVTDSANVTFPKLRLSYEISLEDALAALGMPTAFIELAADLSGIAGAPGDLYISDVRHETFVDINEEGTEAAAVTSVEIVPVCGGCGPLHIVVNRPFLFAIRERFSGTVLFLGRVGDPTGG